MFNIIHREKPNNNTSSSYGEPVRKPFTPIMTPIYNNITFPAKDPDKKQ